MKKLAYTFASATFKLFFGLNFEEMEVFQSHQTKCLHELHHFQALLTQELLDAGFVLEKDFVSNETTFWASSRASIFLQSRSRYFRQFAQALEDLQKSQAEIKKHSRF